jgi:hypothetical protein
MIRILPALFLLSSLCFAQVQPGVGYKLFNEGCLGSGGPGCFGANFQGGAFQPLLQRSAMEIAVEFDTDQSVLVMGLDFWCRGNANRMSVPVAIYLASSAGIPNAKALATATMVVGTKPAWYRATFARPFKLKKGLRVFAAVQMPTGASRLTAPAVRQGFKRYHFQRVPSKSPTWSRRLLSQNWAWRLNCAGGTVRAAPVITGAAKGPWIGKTYSLHVSIGPTKAPAFIVTGVSNRKWGAIGLPLDLKTAGAPGCQLFVSMDLLAFVLLDAAGKATLSFPIPNQRSLIKKRFYNQAICLDAKANKLGLTFTNGGIGTIVR